MKFIVATSADQSYNQSIFSQSNLISSLSFLITIDYDNFENKQIAQVAVFILSQPKIKLNTHDDIAYLVAYILFCIRIFKNSFKAQQWIFCSIMQPHTFHFIHVYRNILKYFGLIYPINATKRAVSESFIGLDNSSRR